MAKGPKLKKAKNGIFTIHLRYDGLFVSTPLQYVDGEMREISDINFDGMSLESLVEIVMRLIPANHSIQRLYYSKNDTTLALGIREIKSDTDVVAMLNAGYENGNLIDLYVEHYDYDVMEYIKQSEADDQIIEDSDDYYSSDECADIDYVDFQNVGDENVVIKDISTPDTFLNRLCSSRVTFKKPQVPGVGEIPEEDPDGDRIDPVYKVKKGVVYPAFDPELPWDKMEPVLGMRYESAFQLKLALTNYGVAHGYQLWFMKNDWRELLVYCGRNVAEGKCAGKKGKKDRVMPNKDRYGLAKKQQALVDSGEGSSKHSGEGSRKKSKKTKAKRASCQSPKWKKKKISSDKYVPCTFRLYASWTSNEHSFQIKSLIPDHKCCRNYNLGSLVNFKWIAAQYMKEIIADPFMPYRKMKEDIRQKYHIDVSIGQCKRARQRALYEHEGGLIEHYNKLYQYKQAILESNPGSTCVLDVDGSAYFKRMYICFKGVKDGWLAGCRKVIGLDGCFLKHTCKGELLTAMGRDANNQMYPIAWAVVRVENSQNWGWFLKLLKDDLCLNDGTGITIISDSHKGLLDAVSDWLPHAEHRRCTRHVFANFKKKFSGLLFQRLFWAAAASTLEQQFQTHMERIKELDQRAYDYLIQRNPNSWSRAFFEMDRRCAAFENGISESYHRAILGPRNKPIITMLEEIRLYIMQRIVAMNKIAFNLEDSMTPSIRKRLEVLKVQQRLVDMDTRRQFSSMSMSEKRDRLMLLAINLKMRKRKLTKRKLVKLGNLEKEESSNTENRDTKPKMKLNGHLYKKMFQKAGQKQKMMLLNQVDDKIVEGSCAKRPCTGPKRKRKKRRIALLSERFGFGKRESTKEPSHISSMDDSKHSLRGLCEICISGGELLLCSGQGCGKSFHRACLDPPLPHKPHGPWHCGSCTKKEIEPGSVELSDFQFEVPSKTRNHVLPYVNKLRDYWHRGHSAVFFDEQERLLKAVIFILSLLDYVRRPILIIAATRALSEWEAEFSKWSRFTNVVTYKGSEYVRAAIRNLEFYDENESITFQVLLSSPDVIVEDMDMLDHIKWELIVIDECQRPLMWSHINKIRRLDAHMKLLTISDKAVDTRQRYHDILSLLDSKYKAGHMKRTIDTETLKSKMSPFVAFECEISTPEFNEYWIPVHLSSMQIKQYCSILDSNFQILSSCLRDDSSLQDIIIETQKCCDHPYLVDPNLRNSFKEDASIDSLDVDINVSGKLQLLDKFLSEIKQCGFRVVVLFQPVDNLEKICIGDILDDLVDRRFGQDSYIRIGKICTKSDRRKKKQSLEMFNNVENRKFICLLDYRVCHSSVHLSRMDVAILFNGDWNSSNDIRALQKITIESPSQQLKVFRLYSAFTVEEKALMILKEGATMETYITASICHQLLAWGASYLLSKIGSENVSSSFIDDVVHELSSVLRNTSSKMDHTKFSIISKAQINDGTYSSSTKLLGETETGAHTKESWLTGEYLIENVENGPSDFWSNLLKDSENRQKNPCCRISRRIQKSPQNTCYLFEGYKPKSKKKNTNATISPSVRKKARSRRKRRARIRGYLSSEMSHTPHQGDIQRDTLPFNITPTQPAPHVLVASGSRTNEAEQCQSNEPLDIETERIQKEREQVAKLHKEKKLMLITECEKEITEIRKKYDAIIRESEMSLTDQLKIFEDYHQLVNANKLLAEFIIHHCDDTLNLHGPDKDTSSIAVPQVPASATVRPANPCSTSVRPTNPCSTSVRPANLCSTSVLTTRFSGQNIGMRGLRAPAPHLRSPSLFASVHNLPATHEPFLEPLPTLSTLETLPHIQTAPNTGVHQVDLKNIPKLPMEFDKYYGMGTPSFPLLSSNHNTS